MYEVDKAFCDAQVMPFKRAFCLGESKALSWKRGRIDTNAYARRDLAGFFRRRQKSVEGKAKITLFVDCSGSMSGEPAENAVQLCAVLSRLHGLGLVEVVIICTGYSGGSTKANGGGGFKVPMPQPDWVWERLSARHGREGLSQTFRNFKSEIANSDMVSCYTDADISDGSLTPELWRKYGISCVGMYVGDINQVDVMLRYFDYALARSSIEDLFASYLNLVRKILRAKR